MKKRGIFRIWKVFLAFAIVSAITLGSFSTAAATTKITYLTPWPKNAYDSKNFIDYIDKIQKEADKKFPGELEFVYKGGPEVVHTFEQIEACRKGVVQMLLSAPSYYASVMPELDLLGLTDMKPWEQRATGLFEYIDKLHNKKTNTHYLAQSGIGVPFQLHLSKPINSPEDLKGMKIRSSATNIPFLKAVGAEPVSMPPPDVYTAMERGVVQGFILPAYTAKDFGLVKVTDYLVFPGLYYPTNSWLINLDTWNKLPKHLQDFLDKKAREYERINFARIAERHEKEMEYFKEHGVTINRLTPEEANRLNKIAREALVKSVKKKAPEETKEILSYFKK